MSATNHLLGSVADRTYSTSENFPKANPSETSLVPTKVFIFSTKVLIFSIVLFFPRSKDLLHFREFSKSLAFKNVSSID